MKYMVLSCAETIEMPDENEYIDNETIIARRYVGALLILIAKSWMNSNPDPQLHPDMQ